MPLRAKKGYKKKCDDIFSIIIRSQGFCEAQGWADRPCSPQLQTAHIVTRGRSATRTDLRNAFCLCAAHHRFFHDYPRQFSRFITTTWAQEFYEQVEQESYVPTRLNWQDRLAFLKDMKLALEAGEITLSEARLYNQE